MEMVTLMPRLPFSAKSCAMDVSNTRQSLFMMAVAMPSWMERGVASPGQAAPVAVELQPVGEVLRLLASADELHDGEELLVAVVLLLLLQHQHEVEAEARLHHHPVHRSGEVDVRGQEHDVLPLLRHTHTDTHTHTRDELVNKATQS